MSDGLVFRGFISGLCAVCGTLAGVLGGGLSGHWRWGVAAVAFLIMMVIVGVGEFFKSIWEHGQSSRDHDYQGHATLARGVGVAVLAVVTGLASLGVSGGVLYLVHHFDGAHQASKPGIFSPEPPPVLVADGGHATPAAAVSGFLGDELVGAYTNLCGYYLPSQQHWCLQNVPQTQSRAQSGTAGIGFVEIRRTRAVVAVVGRFCPLEPTTQGSSCRSNSNPYFGGVGQGTSFTRLQ